MEWKLNFRDDGILEIKSNGTFSIDDFKKLIEEVISDTRWKPGMDTISDLSEVDVKDIKHDDIHSTENIHKQYNDELGNGKIAAILNTDIGFGLGRTYEAISSRNIKSSIMIFRNYEDGMGWIQGKEIWET
jgi:hypothetical protein